jgi:hypothetical protein
MMESFSNNPHTNRPLAEVLKDLQACADLPFDQAHPITPAVNHSQEFLHHERNGFVSDAPTNCPKRALSSLTKLLVCPSWSCVRWMAVYVLL